MEVKTASHFVIDILPSQKPTRVDASVPFGHISGKSPVAISFRSESCGHCSRELVIQNETGEAFLL